MWFFKNKNISDIDIRELLSRLNITDKNIIAIKIDDSNIKIIVNVNNIESYKNLQSTIETELYKISKAKKIFVVLTSDKKQEPKKENIRKNINKIIAIASGKGGVGKSTVAINLACALSKQGLKVGLMDADIYGPSVPKLAGLSNKKPEKGDTKLMKPLEKFGIKFMSIGFMIEEGSAIIWRGPKAQGAVIQMVRDVEWGELDVLVIDMPPGTGDIQLTISQKIGIDGAIIVSTPQDMALIDARKAIDMFDKLNIPILGIIENMSTHICSKCGHEEHIFGNGGAKQEAKSRNLPLLAEIPLDMTVRLLSDEGIPIVIQKPDSKAGQQYLKAGDTIEHILKL